MNVLITGGTGFIGKALCRALTDRGDSVWVYSRRSEKVQALCGDAVHALVDLGELGDVTFDAVVNLAGEPIADRPWTKRRREVLLGSRIQLTDQLIESLISANQKLAVFISGSAVGYYGDTADESVDENFLPNVDTQEQDFAHQLCRQWEAAADGATQLATRICKVRIGIVMGEGGFLGPLMPLFRFGLGARLGDGAQFMSWISHRDMVRLLIHLLDDPSSEGIFNATAPVPVTNRAFTTQLAATLNRPAIFFVPAPLLRLLGDLSTLLLKGQRVVPTRLQASGFEFRDANLASALEELQH
jgi:uncharacterized protein (TIGR01777 family)